MKAFRILFALITLMVIVSFGVGNKLYKLEKDLMGGDKIALFKIATYFDKRKHIIEYLGHHVLHTEVSEIAKRIVEENTLFTHSEFVLDTLTSKAAFTAFLTKNEERIHFSTSATAFLITPLADREVQFELRELSPDKLSELLAKRDELLSLEWIQTNHIDSLIKEQNPVALFEIAALFFRERYRFDRYPYNASQFMDLLKLLTRVDIAVPNEKNELTYFIDQEFYPHSRLNLLIYFTKYYKDYRWNTLSNSFINRNHVVKSIGEEEVLFEMLSSEDSTTAMNAFVRITILDPEKVGKQADAYEDLYVNKNSYLPTFPYRFVKQMSKLTDYCRKHEIDYSKSERIREYINQLDKRTTFKEKYALENKIIDSLTLESITAFEYWTLVYEQSSDLTFSAGRILDIFYSKNWSKLTSSDKYLELYLKKVKLYNELGIVGICNNFLNKFINASPQVIERLKQIKTTDEDIQDMITKVIEINRQKIKWASPEDKYWGVSQYQPVKDVEKHFLALLNKPWDKNRIRDSAFHLIETIDYAQIGIVLKHYDKLYFENSWDRRPFLETDFGLPKEPIYLQEDRDEFLEKYTTLSEYELYAYYLDKEAIDYKNSDNSLNYDKVYEILKYDIVTPFVGGLGGSKQTLKVYMMVKLLEINFNTTLGYPKKLCYSAGTHYCGAYEQAMDWIVYLEKNHLLKLPHDEPVSFSFRAGLE